MDTPTVGKVLSDILTIDGCGFKKKAQLLLILVSEVRPDVLVHLLTNATYDPKFQRADLSGKSRSGRRKA